LPVAGTEVNRIVDASSKVAFWCR